MAKIDYRRYSVDEGWKNTWDNLLVECELEGIQVDPDYAAFLENYSSETGLILEGGCGLGRFVLHLKSLDYNVIGVDYYTGALRAIHAYNNETNLATANVFNLPFADCSFDTYISLGVFEHHVTGMEEGLAEAHRVIKPGGLLLISGPNYNLLDRLDFLLNPIQKLKEHDELRMMLGKAPLPPKNFWQYRLTLSEITKQLIEANFSVEDQLAWGHASLLWYSLPLLRSKAGNIVKDRSDLAKIKMFNTLGQLMYKLTSSYFSWYFALAWCIAARKPV